MTTDFREQVEQTIRGFSTWQPNDPNRLVIEVDDQQPLIDALDKLHEAEVAELHKAYGGCTKCYGKGYATYEGQYRARGMTWSDDHMKFCDCERGSQLRAAITPKEGDK